MNPALAQIMTSKLLRNALFHNSPFGEFSGFINKGSLVISNTDVNETLDPERVFKNFYKYSVKQENTGLGLAIVKAIADIYNKSISYSYQKQMHCFNLLFL